MSKIYVGIIVEHTAVFKKMSNPKKENPLLDAINPSIFAKIT